MNEDVHPLTKIIWNQFKRSRDHYSGDYDGIDEWDKYWERSEDVVGATQDWEERIHVPLVYDAEQELTPRILAVITATDPPFDVVGVEKRDDRGALAIKHLEGHHFELSKFDTKAIYYVRQGAVRGTTIAQVFWNRKERYITSREIDAQDITEKDPITGEEVAIGREVKFRGKTTKKVKVKNHPDFEIFSVLDAFPDPDSVDFDDDLPFIRRQKASLQNLKEWNETAEALGMDKFENLDKLEEEIIKKVKDKKEQIYETQVNITLIHYWGLVKLSSYDVDTSEQLKGKMIPSWITIGYTDENEETLRGKHFMRAIENPYWHGKPPFVKSVWIKKKIPSWFGIGIAEAGQSSADRVNEIVNMRLANIKRIINKRFKYNINDPLLDIDAAERGEPGGGIGMSDIRNMEWEQIGDVTQSSYLEEKMAKEDFREATGASAAIAPGPRGEQHSTVRGMMLLQGAAGERLKPIAKDIEQTFNKELVQFYHELSHQFMKDEEKFEILGEDGKYYPTTVKPEQIVSKVNFRTTGVSEIVNREMQINQLLQFKQLTMNDPTVNKAEINKRIAILFGFKDLDSLIRKLTLEQEAQYMNAGRGGAEGATKMPSPEGAGQPPKEPGEEILGFEGKEESVI